MKGYEANSFIFSFSCQLFRTVDIQNAVFYPQKFSRNLMKLWQ